MKHFINIILILILSSSFNKLISQTHHEHYIDGIVYFKVKAGSGISILPDFSLIPEIDLIVSTYNIDTIIQPFPDINDTLDLIYRMYFNNYLQTEAIISDLEDLNFIRYAEKSPLHRIDVLPNDYDGDKLWHLEKIKAPLAWNVTTGSENIVIAIVDNGILLSHEDLESNIWVNPGEIPDNNIDDELNGFVDDIHGWDVADNNNDPNPPDDIDESNFFNHGSHCAGIASAVTNNGIGIASIGYSSKIMAVKCAGDNTNGDLLTNVNDGIYYAIRSNADIISMSFGTEGTSLTGHTIIQTAYNMGILLIAAAGNGNTDNRYYPASYNEVIGVGATDKNDKKASFSNYGNHNVELMAPGTNIYSTIGASATKYAYMNGTSMAAPLVAGLAALIMANNPSLSVSQVRLKLRNSCDDIDYLNPDYNGKLGYGRINAAKALDVEDTSFLIELKNDHFNFRIYPNPSKGLPEIIYMPQNDGKVYFFIFDSKGTELHNFSLDVKKNESIVLEKSEYIKNIHKKGMYIFQAIEGTNSFVEKFIIH